MRVLNMLKWLLFMIEPIMFILIPSSICLPFSTSNLIDSYRLDLESLTFQERQEVKFTLVATGFASLFALFGFGLGCFGRFSPADVFGKILLSRIIEVRHGSACCVCLEKFTLTDEIKVLPCDHVFHHHCIDLWLAEHDECPLCKKCVL